MLLDMHTHSNASDGQYDPKEIVRLAKDQNLQIISITDHDSIGGLEEAEKAASELHIKFIPGIEISAQEKEEIHILGYDVNYRDRRIADACDEYAKDRLRRADRICDFLKSRNIEVEIEDIRKIAGESNVGRPHFARYLLEQGYVSERREAFDKYLDTPEFFEATRRKSPTVPQAIDLIHAVGGKAVLAHPVYIHKTPEQLEHFVRQLCEIRLDGIECFYSQHSDEQTRDYLELSERYGLKISCGSDFHGEKVKAHVKLGMRFNSQKYGHKFIVDVN